jgi:hypothetical protein
MFKLLFAACLVLAALTLGGSAAAVGDSPCVPDDCSSDPLTQYGWGWPEEYLAEDTGIYYDAGESARLGGPVYCRRYAAARQFKTFIGHFVPFRYIQSVYWCFNGVTVRTLTRFRWADVGCCFWEFNGHVAGNCINEYCTGHTGHFQESVWTIGNFRECWTNICPQQRTYGVSITVNANGGAGYYTWE